MARHGARRPDRPRIWQITSSGIKNEFPHTLTEWLDRINRCFYAPWSLKFCHFKSVYLPSYENSDLP